MEEAMVEAVLKLYCIGLLHNYSWTNHGLRNVNLLTNPAYDGPIYHSTGKLLHLNRQNSSQLRSIDTITPLPKMRRAIGQFRTYMCLFCLKFWKLLIISTSTSCPQTDSRPIRAVHSIETVLADTCILSDILLAIVWTLLSLILSLLGRYAAFDTIFCSNCSISAYHSLRWSGLSPTWLVDSNAPAMPAPLPQILPVASRRAQSWDPFFSFVTQPTSYL